MMTQTFEIQPSECGEPIEPLGKFVQIEAVVRLTAVQLTLQDDNRKDGDWPGLFIERRADRWFMAIDSADGDPRAFIHFMDDGRCVMHRDYRGFDVELDNATATQTGDRP